MISIILPMKPLRLLVLLVTLTLLLGGCGEKSSSEGSESVSENPTAPSEEVKPTEEAPVDPNLKYKITSDSVTITGCDKKASGALIIPAAIEGKTVTSIGISAFEKCTNLTSITIPDSVTSIGKYAFLDCTSLTSIIIAEGVTDIGSRAFNRCASLTAVTFLGDAPRLGLNTFRGVTPTIYRKPEAKGWGDTWAGRPVKLISEKP